MTIKIRISPIPELKVSYLTVSFILALYTAAEDYAVHAALAIVEAAMKILFSKANGT